MQRYTSYGRHFTLDYKLQALSERLVTYINDGDTIVDFSCGANDWVPRMQEESARRGLRCYGKAFDIITPINVQNYVQKSWFDVLPGGPVADLRMPTQYECMSLHMIFTTWIYNNIL